MAWKVLKGLALLVGAGFLLLVLAMALDSGLRREVGDWMVHRERPLSEACEGGACPGYEASLRQARAVGGHCERTKVGTCAEGGRYIETMIESCHQRDHFDATGALVGRQSWCFDRTSVSYGGEQARCTELPEGDACAGADAGP